MNRHLQEYLFDLQGYLVIEDALSPQEVDALNALLDRHELPEPGQRDRFGSSPDGSGFLAWGEPFCALLDHPTIMPVLRSQLGDCFRLDRIYGMCMNQGARRGALHADYGATAPKSGVKPGEYFAFRPNQIYSGFIVVTWNLSDTGPGIGGFCCIPGSHKSHYRLPPEIDEDPEGHACVIMPPAPAGSVTIFSEALTHGTAAWHAPHERRSLLYKYCVSHIAWQSRRVQPPPRVELTPRQNILFHAPGDPHIHFPSLFE